MISKRLKNALVVVGLLVCIALAAIVISSIYIEDAVDINKSPKVVHPYLEEGLQPYEPAIKLSTVREMTNDLESIFASVSGETLESNRWSKLFEEVLGIQLNYDWTAKGDSYTQKLNFIINTGQIPDFLLVNSEQLLSLTNAGLIQDLSNIYEKYATPLTKDVLLQEGRGPFDRATINGKLMGIPSISASIEGASFIWIRTDWLKNLDIEPPTTMEEVLAISEAFTNDDPDQNGLKDTFGLGLSDNLWNPVLSAKGFMAGFHAYPQLWIEKENDELVYGGVQIEAKRALEVLQSMYKKGELDPDFYYKKYTLVQEQINSGQIGMLYGEQWSSFFVQGSVKKDDAVWQAYPIVALNGDKAYVPLTSRTNSFFVVNNNYAHPEAIVKLINLHLEKNWGETAEYHTYYSTPYPVWQLSPVTPYPPLKNLEAYRQIKEAYETNDYSKLTPEATYIYYLMDGYYKRTNISAGWGWALTYGENGAFSHLHQYEESNQLLYDKFTGALTATMLERNAFLRELQHDTYMNIILGSSIDEFDQFVDVWFKLGGNQMTKEVNEWYKANY